jgi:hypothetical protein
VKRRIRQALEDTDEVKGVWQVGGRGPGSGRTVGPWSRRDTAQGPSSQGEMCLGWIHLDDIFRSSRSDKHRKGKGTDYARA